MPYNSIRLSEIPEAGARVEICHDALKTMVWLQLSAPDGNPQNGPIGYTKHLIGAEKDGSGWKAIRAVVAARSHVKLSYGTRINDQMQQGQQNSPVERFQQAIIEHWKSFDGTNAAQYAKPLSVGVDLSSPSFVMRAIKTGFDRTGTAGHAYGGLQFRGFTVDDVISYMERGAATNISVLEPGLEGFKEVAPLSGQAEDDPALTDRRKIPYIASAKPHGGRFAYPEIGLTVPFPRVIGYGFRGEKRAPKEVKDAGGFNPNYTRPDHIAQAVTKNSPQDQALDLEIFLGNQFYGGFISVSKSIAVAKAFGSNMAKTTGSNNRHRGWVYACYAEGAFEIPPAGTIAATATHPQVSVSADEQELAMPGLLDWEDVVACRRVDRDGYFEGNIYLREKLEHEDKEASFQVLRLLSGQTQGV